jgi:hypothetical protein
MERENNIEKNNREEQGGESVDKKPGEHTQTWLNLQASLEAETDPVKKREFILEAREPETFSVLTEAEQKKVVEQAFNILDDLAKDFKLSEFDQFSGELMQITNSDETDKFVGGFLNIFPKWFADEESHTGRSVKYILRHIRTQSQDVPVSALFECANKISEIGDNEFWDGDRPKGETYDIWNELRALYEENNERFLIEVKRRIRQDDIETPIVSGHVLRYLSTEYQVNELNKEDEQKEVVKELFESLFDQTDNALDKRVMEVSRNDVFDIGADWPADKVREFLSRYSRQNLADEWEVRIENAKKMIEDDQGDPDLENFILGKEFLKSLQKKREFISEAYVDPDELLKMDDQELQEYWVSIRNEGKLSSDMHTFYRRFKEEQVADKFSGYYPLSKGLSSNPSPSVLVPLSTDYLVELDYTGEAWAFYQHKGGPALPESFDRFGLEHETALDSRYDTEVDRLKADELPFIKLDEKTIDDVKRQHAAADLYKAFVNLDVLDGIEEDYGFPVRDLTLREQVWFTESLKDYTVEDEQEVIEFTQKYGLDGARAFLSVEHGEEFRDYVLEIGEGLEQEAASKIFAKYAEISEVAQEQVSDILDEYIEEEDEVDRGELEVKVEKELLNRAKRLLSGVAKQIKAGEEPDIEQIESKLEGFAKDTVLFASVFKSSFKENPELDPEVLRGVEVAGQPTEDLTEDEKRQILQIAATNWRSQASEEEADYVLRGLRKKLESSDTRFYTLKKDDDIAAFLRFDELGQDEVYAGSFNVKPDMRGSALGEAMLRETISKESDHNTIKGHVSPNTLAGTAYVEKFGAVLDGVERVGQDDPNLKEEVYDFTLTIDKIKNRRYRAKEEGVGLDELKEGVEGVRLEEFDASDGAQDMIEAVREAQGRGEVVSRYLYDPENPSVRYLAFEPEVVAEQAQVAA